MVPGTATVPWATWDESVGGVHRIFVSRLVGTGTAAHFQIVNNGAPVSGSSDALRPDITFSANTPFVSWRAQVGGVTRGFVGHFINPANPTFVLDESNIPLTPTSAADVREPISSNCTANPFNGDGSACQGGSVPTPFFLFTNGTSPLRLFAGAVTTGAFTPTARLLRRGRAVAAAGPTPVCRRGEKILLRLSITRHGVTATGAWHNKHACNGNPQQWKKVLTVGGRRRLTTGRAIGHATARITAHGHMVRTVRWSAPVRLVR
jgi:hypothetical protein